MKIRLYINSKSFFWKLIQVKQGWLLEMSLRYSRITHVEIEFSDGMSFSSSEQDGGVRFKKIEYKPENWEFIEIPVTEVEENKIRKWCESKTNNAYNWWGIFFAMGINFFYTKNDDYFCSQIVTRALQQVWMCADLCSLMTTPGQLAKYLEDQWYPMITKNIYDSSKE